MKIGSSPKVYVPPTDAGNFDRRSEGFYISAFRAWAIKYGQRVGSFSQQPLQSSLCRRGPRWSPCHHVYILHTVHASHSRSYYALFSSFLVSQVLLSVAVLERVSMICIGQLLHFGFMAHYSVFLWLRQVSALLRRSHKWKLTDNLFPFLQPYTICLTLGLA
jgi:hypothetical protein